MPRLKEVTDKVPGTIWALRVQGILNLLLSYRPYPFHMTENRGPKSLGSSESHILGVLKPGLRTFVFGFLAQAVLLGTKRVETPFFFTCVKEEPLTRMFGNSACICWGQEYLELAIFRGLVSTSRSSPQNSSSLLCAQAWDCPWKECEEQVWLTKQVTACLVSPVGGSSGFLVSVPGLSPLLLFP